MPQNRNMRLDHIAEAERQLAELAARVERQRALVQGLEACGQETAHAAFLLQQAIGLKALHEAHRDWLKRELTKCDEPHRPNSAARSELKTESGCSPDATKRRVWAKALE